MNGLNRATVEQRLFELARKHVPPEFFASRPTAGPPQPDLLPTCGHGAGGGRPVFWTEFLCEPRDKLLQTALMHAEEAMVEWEYLCNETNILDRLCKSVEFYRNPEVGQTPACFWECAADQLQRRSPAHAKVTAAEVKCRCLRWMREEGEGHAMGPDCSLPLPPGAPVPEVDDGVDRGTRCTLGEYVAAARGLAWREYVDRLERPETWADVLCLFALSEEFSCTVVVCSKTFPYPDFCCRFGGGEGPQLLLAHWKGVQFRSVLPRDEWDQLYERMKREKGLERLDHRLYAGLLRYQDRAEEAIAHCKLEVERDARSLVGHHTWSIVLSDNFRAEEAMQHYLAQLEIAPDHPHSYNGVGTTLHDMRRYEDAIFFYKAQLFFNPRNKYSHLNLSLAHARLKQFEEAEREHLLQLALHPTDRNTCDYYLELLNDMKKSEQGVAFFRALVAKEPWRNDWRSHLARAHMCCKEYDRAALELREVLRRNPDDCRALAAMAELLERNGFYARAAALLRRVLAIFPRHPRCRSFLGDCEVKVQCFAFLSFVCFLLTCFRRETLTLRASCWRSRFPSSPTTRRRTAAWRSCWRKRATRTTRLPCTKRRAKWTRPTLRRCSTSGCAIWIWKTLRKRAPTFSGTWPRIQMIPCRCWRLPTRTTHRAKWKCRFAGIGRCWR